MREPEGGAKGYLQHLFAAHAPDNEFYECLRIQWWECVMNLH